MKTSFSEDTEATSLVDALQATFGIHSHARASHAKGIFCRGEFEPNLEARSALKSPLLDAGKHPVIARHSIAGGNPHVPDTAPAARGLAIDISLPNGEHLVLVMISAPVFFASTPEVFKAFLKARITDPLTGKPNPAAIADVNAAYPECLAQQQYLAQTPPSNSYATAPYFAVHCFYFASEEHGERAGRLSFEPQGGRQGLTPEETKTKSPEFLDNELKQRLLQGPAEWTMCLELAEPGDPLTDPTAAWPSARTKIELGVLRIFETIATAPSDATDRHVFDPNRLPSGVRPVGDPIFETRGPAYGISLARRLGE